MEHSYFSPPRLKLTKLSHLEKLDSEEELFCRVTSLGTSFMGKTQVAVEFIMPTPGFWSKD